SAPLAFQARLASFVPNSNTAFSTPVLRPGAPPVVVRASLSDSSIAVIAPSQLTFNPGESSQSFTVQPAAPGSSLLTLSVPTGFADPVSLRQQLLTVVPARAAFVNPLTVGKDLVRPN